MRIRRLVNETSRCLRSSVVIHDVSMAVEEMVSNSIDAGNSTDLRPKSGKPVYHSSLPISMHGGFLERKLSAWGSADTMAVEFCVDEWACSLHNVVW